MTQGKTIRCPLHSNAWEMTVGLGSSRGEMPPFHLTGLQICPKIAALQAFLACFCTQSDISIPALQFSEHASPF